MQLTHYNSKFEPKTLRITLICDGLSSPFNIGGMFRIADAFGAEQIIFLTSTPSLGKRFKKTSRSAEKYVPYSIQDNFKKAIEPLREQGYQFIALEITDKSIPLSSIQLETDRPVVLVVGSENFGITASILEDIDVHAHINMHGNNSSMNVVQSSAIALYEITNQLK